MKYTILLSLWFSWGIFVPVICALLCFIRVMRCCLFFVSAYQIVQVQWPTPIRHWTSTTSTPTTTIKPPPTGEAAALTLLSLSSLYPSRYSWWLDTLPPSSVYITSIMGTQPNPLLTLNPTLAAGNSLPPPSNPHPSRKLSFLGAYFNLKVV